MKKGLDEEFIHLFANYCLLPASYISEPVLDAKDSALYKVYNAVIFMELSF